MIRSDGTGTTPWRLAVVGHTNTGKTSLLRTLTRDAGFGDVADQPSTTRHVEAAALLAEGRVVLQLYDTPGLEDAVSLRDFLERLAPATQRLDGLARIERFLGTRESSLRFEQEAKVLRQVVASDAALYVIDARDPVLDKHRDELALLADCARPVLPVLNFVRAPQTRVPAWREALSRLGLHAVVEFDTVAPPEDGEALLFGKLATLLDAAAPELQALVADRRLHRTQRRDAAARLVAEMLVDVAALRVFSPPDDAASQRHEAELRDVVRARERRCVDELLALHGFRAGDVGDSELPAWQTRLDRDLFSPEALTDMGVEVGKGVAAGAAAGAAVDLATGGLSLGTGTLVGAAVGGLWQTAERYGGRLLGQWRGVRELTVNDAILRLLAVRQQWLMAALERRGHAAQAPLLRDTDAAATTDPGLRKGALPPPLREARSHPEWSVLAKRHEDSARRQAAIAAMAGLLVNPAPANDEQSPH